jgi:hypothetical protein
MPPGAGSFLNVPLAIIVLGIVFWRVPESRDEEGSARLDWWCAASDPRLRGDRVWADLIVQFGLEPSISTYYPSSWRTHAECVFLRKAHSRMPMMPLSLFRSRTFSGANLLTLLLYSALNGVFFFSLSI